MLAVGGDGRAVRPRLQGHPHDLSTVERDPEEVSLPRVLAARREPDLAAFAVESDDAVDGPVARGQHADECPVAGVQLQVAEARALRRPEDLASLLDDAEVIMEVDPGRGPLFDQRRRLPRLGVESDEPQRLLVAREDLREERSGRLPGHPCEVDVILRVGEREPSGLAPGGIDDAEADPGVGPPGEGVAVGLDRDPLTRLVDDGIGRDGSLVGLLIGDPRAVGRPPEARGSVHLLLRDELGQRMRQAVGRASGQLGFPFRIQIQDVQLVVADERDLGPVPGEPGIDLGGEGLGEPFEGPVAAREVEVATDREDGHVGVLGTDDLGDAGLAEPLPLAAKLLDVGEVRLGIAPPRRPRDHPRLAVLALDPPQHPIEAGRLGLEVRQGLTIGGERECPRHDVPRHGEPGDVTGIDRAPRVPPGRFGLGRLNHHSRQEQDQRGEATIHELLAHRMR